MKVEELTSEQIVKRFLDVQPVGKLLVGNPDIDLIEVYSAIISRNWLDLQTFPKHSELQMMLVAAYFHGYRKGRAATPLTLVVADEKE